MIKFGFDQIQNPSPKNLKLVVNLFIVLGGAAAAIILATPDQYISPELKTYLLGVGGILAGALESVGELTGVSDDEPKP